MKLFNDQAAAAVASLDSADAAYCAKLERASPIWASAQRQPPALCSRLSRPMPCPGWRLGRPALRVQGPFPEENRGEARRLRGVRGFSVRSARLGAKWQAPLLRRTALTLSLSPCCRSCVCRVPLGVPSHRLSSLAGCQFPTQGSLGFPKRKATPPKSAGSLQVSSSKLK